MKKFVIKITSFVFLSGDALPAYNSGKLRVFAMRFCPYAERTILVLNAKNLQYDTVFVNLDNKPEWVFNYSPKGKPLLPIFNRLQ